MQWLLGPRLLNRFGIGTTLAVLPFVVLTLGLVNVLVVRLWTVVLLRGGQMVVQNSFFRSAFELLYTPLPPSRKRPTKAIIDVASDRLGDVVGGSLVLVLLAALPTLPPAVVIGVALVLALATLLIVKRLYDRYVGQLAENLRDGLISLHDDDVIDATTRQTLAEASAASERALLQQRIASLRRKRGGQPLVPRQDTPRTLPPEAAAAELARGMAALTSGDPQRIRACLEGHFMDARLVPFIVPLLSFDALADLARTELRFLVPRCIGALADALFDPDVPLLARQRLPSVLEVSHHRAWSPPCCSHSRMTNSTCAIRVRGRCRGCAARRRPGARSPTRSPPAHAKSPHRLPPGRRSTSARRVGQADESLTVPGTFVNDFGLEHVFTR